MHMIMNNLDPHVAQFPHELVTYGGNGQVFSNWAQVLLSKKKKKTLHRRQTHKTMLQFFLFFFPVYVESKLSLTKTEPRFKDKSEGLEESGIEPATTGLQCVWRNHYSTSRTWVD